MLSEKSDGNKDISKGLNLLACLVVNLPRTFGLVLSVLLD